MFTPRKCHSVKKLPSSDVKNTGNTRRAYIQLREAILELGWSLKDAAEFVGRSELTLWRWTNGLVAVDADALIKLTAAAWGTSSVRIERSAAV